MMVSALRRTDEIRNLSRLTGGTTAGIFLLKESRNRKLVDYHDIPEIEQPQFAHRSRQNGKSA